MVFFRKEYTIRRFSTPKYERGYEVVEHDDCVMQLDVQTTDDTTVNTSSGSRSVHTLEVYSDEELRIADVHKKQKADMLLFQNKWFICISSYLCENTILRHYISTFVEILDYPEDDEAEVDEDAFE